MNQPSLAPSPVDRAQILNVARYIGVLGGGTGTAPRFMTALCDPHVDADEVKGWLKGEPSLCARVLKVANSPLYGQVSAVASIDRALIVLGLDTLRGIAAAACLDRAIVGGKSTLLDLNSVVSHCQATAAAADSLARYCFPELASSAFIAGLLHNLGTVVQMHIDPAGVRALLAARRDGDGRNLAVLEAELTAIGHEECGAVIFEEWCLPVELVAAARHHHSPLLADAAERRLTGLINVSSALALASGAGMALESASPAAHPETLQCLGLDEGQLAEAFVAVAGRITELKKALR
jgi:HD-like signal output (HDOD) protein